jgi:hypothetical protein
MCFIKNTPRLITRLFSPASNANGWLKTLWLERDLRARLIQLGSAHATALGDRVPPFFQTLEKFHHPFISFTGEAPRPEPKAKVLSVYPKEMTKENVKTAEQYRKCSSRFHSAVFSSELASGWLKTLWVERDRARLIQLGSAHANVLGDRVPPFFQALEKFHHPFISFTGEAPSLRMSFIKNTPRLLARQ